MDRRGIADASLASAIPLLVGTKLHSKGWRQSPPTNNCIPCQNRNQNFKPLKSQGKPSNQETEDGKENAPSKENKLRSSVTEGSGKTLKHTNAPEASGQSCPVGNEERKEKRADMLHEHGSVGKSRDEASDTAGGVSR